MELVYDGRLWIVPHPAGAAVVRAAAAVVGRRRPYLGCTGRLQDLNRPLPEEFHVLEVVGMARGRDAHRRQAPIVFYIRIEIDAIGFERHRRDKAAAGQLWGGFPRERLLVNRV